MSKKDVFDIEGNGQPGFCEWCGAVKEHAGMIGKWYCPRCDPVTVKSRFVREEQ